MPPVYVGPNCRVSKALLGPNVVLVSNVIVEDASLENVMAFGDNRAEPGSLAEWAVLEEKVVLEENWGVIGKEAAPVVMRMQWPSG